MIRNTTKIIVLLLLAAIAFASCSKEGTGDGEYEQAQAVSVRIGLNNMKSLTEGTTEDREIKSLRILMFNRKDGKLAFNEFFPQSHFDDPKEQEIEIEILTGKYDFIFIANEILDTDNVTNPENGHDILHALRIETDRVSAITDLTFNESVFTNYYPMFKEVKDVAVIGDNAIKIGDETTITGVWEVKLTRIGIKVSFNIKLTQAQYELFYPSAGEKGTVKLSNIPKHSYLFPEKYNDFASGEDYRSRTITYTVDTETIYPDDDKIVATLHAERIVLPETIFSTKTDKSKGVVLAMTYPNGMMRSATIGFDISSGTPDYTIPRNTYIGVTATVADRIILTNVTVNSWDTENIDLP